MTPSHEHIVNECAAAVAICYSHYGDEELSSDGIRAVREALMSVLPKQTHNDYWPSSEYPEFRDRIIWPHGWSPLEFDQ